MAIKQRPFLRDSFMGGAFLPLHIFADALVQVSIPGDPGKERMDLDTGEVTGGKPIPLWKGYATVTPNMDWRARNRRWAFEDTGTHAYRVQLMHIDMNQLVDEDDWGKPEKRVSFGEGLLVEILSNRANEKSVGFTMVVRNAQVDNNQWQPTLLCDADTGDTFVEKVNRG